MVYQFLYQAVADVTFHINLVPVFLVEMKRSFYAVVSVSQLDGIFRFAFQEYPVRISRFMSANILSTTLNTRLYSSKGKHSVTAFFLIQYSLILSISIFKVLPHRRDEGVFNMFYFKTAFLSGY